jgi:DNA-binding IclR family transcriptional regulator
LEKIAKETGDTVYLQVRAGDETICLSRVFGAFRLAVLVLDVGSRLPMGVGAAGLAFLMLMDDEERDAVLNRGALEFKKYNLRPEKVRAAINESRRVGYAVQHGQSREGVSGVAVLLIDENGNATGAVSVIALTSRMDAQRMRQVVKIIRSACADLHGLQPYPKHLPNNQKQS